MNYGDLILNDVKVVEKFAHSGGGGIYSVSGSSLSMTESIIANNQVIGHGGGLSVSGDVPLILTNVVIDQNEAGSSNMGGGIYVNYSPIPASMTLDKVMISGNVGKGGVYMDGGSDMTIMNSTFSGNSSGLSFGGGIYVEEYVHLNLGNVTISANQAASFGNHAGD